MFNRTNRIPARFWVTIGIMAGMVFAVVASAGSLMSGSDADSPMSKVQAHNADVAEVMAMMNR